MGSTGGSEQDEITVLVTGFEPFKEGYPRNPSWEIAKQLPAYLPPLRAKSTNTPDAASPSPSSLLPVRIHVHPEPVPVSYRAVRDLVPRLYDDSPETVGPGRRKPDIAIHVGMAGEDVHYSIELKGHREGYRVPDNDGKLLDDEKRHQDEGEKWIWHGLPRELETEFDLDDVLRRWRGHVPDNADLRISHDAGHYLCDFIYYSSLAHLYKKNEHRRVVFLHVPSKNDDAIIASGRTMLLELIRSLVESERTRAKVTKEEAR